MDEQRASVVGETVDEVHRGIRAVLKSQRGQHITASGNVAKDAAQYPRELCRAIIRGMMAEMQDRGIWRPGGIGLHSVCDDVTPASGEGVYSKGYRDDISGQPLRDDLVREARAKELEYFCSKGVWAKRPKDEARQRTGKGAISVRWVDVNKGMTYAPNTGPDL